MAWRSAVPVQCRPVHPATSGIVMALDRRLSAQRSCAQSNS